MLAALALPLAASGAAWGSGEAERPGEHPERSPQTDRPPECRCAPLTLDEYFGGADEVVLATLARAEEGDAADADGADAEGAGAGTVHLHLVLAERPWKRAAGGVDAGGAGAGALQVGDTVRYRTAASTATCGVPVVVGATYVAFAFEEPVLPGAADVSGAEAPVPSSPRPALRIDSCSGTRIYRLPGQADPEGFRDVPGRLVPSRLDALGGAVVLRDVVERMPDADDPANGSLVGLLDLKALAHGGVVPVHSRLPENVTADTAPAAPTDAPIAAPPGLPVLDTVRSYADVVSREVGYEVGAAVVLARVAGWSRVRLADGRAGWVAPADAGTFFPYEELPVRRLAYLTGSWSGYLWPDPGAGIPVRSARKGTEPREEYAVEVRESRVVGDLVWFRVALYEEGPCEGGDPGFEAGGWVPGYGADGDPTAWYYSRGC